jgi:HK97 family phage major capsid protein
MKQEDLDKLQNVTLEAIDEKIKSAVKEKDALIEEAKKEIGIIKSTVKATEESNKAVNDKLNDMTNKHAELLAEIEKNKELKAQIENLELSINKIGFEEGKNKEKNQPTLSDKITYMFAKASKTNNIDEKLINKIQTNLTASGQAFMNIGDPIFVKRLEDVGNILSRCSVYVTENQSFPVHLIRNEVEFNGSGENSPITISNPQLVEGSYKIDSHIIDYAIEVTYEQLMYRMAGGLGIDSLLNDQTSIGLAKTIEKKLIQGTGVREGFGLLKDPTISKVKSIATINDLTLDELADLQDELDVVYQSTSCYLMNKKTRTMLRKEKTGAGEYAWEKDIQNGNPLLLWGSPVILNDYMDLAQSGKTPVFYGDLKKFFVTRTSDIRMDIVPTSNGYHEFLYMTGLGSKFVDGNAAVKLVIA